MDGGTDAQGGCGGVSGCFDRDSSLEDDVPALAHITAILSLEMVSFEFVCGVVQVLCR